MKTLDLAFIVTAVSLAGCGSGAASPGADAGGVESMDSASKSSAIKHVFVIALENQDGTSIYGNASAPYLNGLMATYAYSTHYGDDYLHPNLPSEPHYLQMEAGTNVFSDHTFTNDKDPSTANSTASRDHLATRIADLPGASWMTYQEDLPAACPVTSVFPYAAKHNPFVFFRDVAFSADGTPDPSNAYCAAHHKDFASSLAADLDSNNVATYSFITPNICNDMHGDARCTNACTATSGGYGPCIAAGDSWLATNLPPLIAYAEANQGVIFLVWDEAEGTSSSPFFAIGPHIKAGVHTVAYDHASLVKSIEEIVGLSVSANVANAHDFSELFEQGYFP